MSITKKPMEGEKWDLWRKRQAAFRGGKRPPVYTRPDGSRVVKARDSSYDPEDPSRGRANQEARADADINNLIKKYRALGVWPSGDLSAIPDVDTTLWPKNLEEVFAITARATEQFEALPAEIRRRLGGDPRRLATLSADEREDIERWISKQQVNSKNSPVGGGSGEQPPTRSTKKETTKSAKTDESDQE